MQTRTTPSAGTKCIYTAGKCWAEIFLLTIICICGTQSQAQTCQNSHSQDRLVVLGDSHFTDSVGQAFVNSLGSVKAHFGVGKVDRYAVWGATACDWNNKDLSLMQKDDGTVDHNFYTCEPGLNHMKGPPPSSFPLAQDFLSAGSTPKAVIIELGTNDIRRNCLADNADIGMKCARDLATKVSQSNTSCVWIGPPAYDHLTPCTHSQYDAYVDTLAAQVMAGKCQFVDTRAFQEKPCNDLKKPDAGRLHYRDSQATQVGQCFAEAVGKILPSSNTSGLNQPKSNATQ